MIDIFKRIKKALWILRNGTPLKCPSCNSKNLRYVGFESNAGTKTGFEQWRHECLDCHVFILDTMEWAEPEPEGIKEVPQ